MNRQNVVYIYNGVLFNHEILSHGAIWMNLDDIMPSEISQSEKEKYV